MVVKLQEEIIARLEAERRLKEAELSLARLDIAVNHPGNEERCIEEVQEEMKGDVRTLKSKYSALHLYHGLWDPYG